MFIGKRVLNQQTKYYSWIFLFTLISFVTITRVAWGEIPANTKKPIFWNFPESVFIEMCWIDVSDKYHINLYESVLIEHLKKKKYIITIAKEPNCEQPTFFKKQNGHSDDNLYFMNDRVMASNYSHSKHDAFIYLKASYKNDYIKYWMVDMNNKIVMLHGITSCWSKPCIITERRQRDKHTIETYTYKKTYHYTDTFNRVFRNIPMVAKSWNDIYTKEYRTSRLRYYNKYNYLELSLIDPKEVRILGIKLPNYSEFEKLYVSRIREYRFKSNLKKYVRDLRDNVKSKINELARGTGWKVYVKCYKYIPERKEILGEVFVNNININVELIKLGLVSLNAEGILPGMDIDVYRDAQEKARIEKNGIWGPLPF